MPLHADPANADKSRAGLTEHDSTATRPEPVRVQVQNNLNLEP